MSAARSTLCTLVAALSLSLAACGGGGGTKIQVSATSGATATATEAISNLAVDVDGLQINNKGNLVAIDTATGAKLINLATGTPGTVTNLTDGAACATTVAIYKADAWCSDSVGKVIRLVGAGDS